MTNGDGYDVRERSDGDAPRILIVDDEVNVSKAYELWLPDEYEVLTADGGRAALETMDESIDVVLLDRRMPVLSGDEVLSEIRSRGYEPYVAMVTAVDPDFDIVEMAFEAYLTKPIDRDELVETVERLVTLSNYSETVREHFRLSEKLVTLESELPESELTDSQEYAALTERVEKHRRELRATAASVDEETMVQLFRDIDP